MATVTLRKRNGKPVPIGTAAAFDNLAAAFNAAMGCKLLVNSGMRTHAEQEALFFARYKKQKTGVGPFGDVRVYEGIRFVRISAAGTVALPGTSRHESGRAIDVADSGAGAGVEEAGNTRSKWIRRNAKAHGFKANGFGFGEPWHIEFTGDPFGDAKAPARPAVVPAQRGAAVKPLIFFAVIERSFMRGNKQPLGDVAAVQRRLNVTLHAGLVENGIVDNATRAAYLRYETHLFKRGLIPIANTKPSLGVIERLCSGQFRIR